MTRYEVMDWTGVEDPYNPGMDFPTAWAIQWEMDDDALHLPACSWVQARMLCDCGAIREEHARRILDANAGDEGPDA